ncbi:MAG: protein kinase, partial [Chloroflexi bacterium]|nr:protein kinase [Chloroflexota bacterium]
YLPGYESELSSGTLKPGQAVRPSQASIGGEKANQRKNQKGFAALLPAPMRKWWNQRKKKSNQTDDDTMVAEPADPQPTQPTQAAQAAQPTQADAERRRVPIDGRLGDVTAVSPQTQPQPTAATIAPLPVTTTIAPTTAEIPHPIAPQVGRQPLSNEFILSLNDIADENPPDLIGKRLDRYQIDAQLAHGRLGTLYQGFDLKLGRQVAVKLIRPPFIQTAEQQSQLLKSIQAIANIEHPGIAEIHDFELEQGHLLLVSEFIQGPTIDAYTNHMKSQAWQ